MQVQAVDSYLGFTHEGESTVKYSLTAEIPKSDKSSGLTEQNVEFLLSYPQPLADSLPSLNCNKCVEVVHNLAKVDRMYG